MQVLKDVLTRSGIEVADGRALHAYEPTAEEIDALRRLLPLRVNPDLKSPVTAQAFVLWACEYIRTTYPGGQLTWEFVFTGLSMPPADYFFTQWLVETGLNAWRRKLRQSNAGHREFLYTLVAEGGLPDAALAEANRYGAVLLRLIADLEAEGALASVAATLAARRHLGGLPQALRHEEQARLLSDLALGLVELRAALPRDLPVEAAVGWLDTNRPGWRASLPLRMSARALEAVVRPALVATKATARQAGSPVQRELRRGSGGTWRGVARLVEGGLLPASLMPDATKQRLRLVADSGASFLAQPEQSGWRLTQTAGSQLLALAPDEAVVLSAYVDGSHRGDLVVDAGLPSPAEAPTLWRPANAAETDPEVLVPLSGRGQTQAAEVWLLAAQDAVLQPGEWVSLGSSAPAPGGRIWAVSGQGRVSIEGRALTIATGAETDSPSPHLSRDSLIDQRIDASLPVECRHGGVDGAVEGFGVGEGLVGQMMRFEVVPDNLDVVELGGVFWQPLDGEPMLAGIERLEGELADMDRSVVLDQHDRLEGLSGLGAIEAVDLLKMGDEVGAALGRARLHDEPAGGVVERADDRHFPGLSGGRHPQVRPAPGPSPRQIGMGEGLALVAVE